MSVAEGHRAENIRLWQSLTSESIPANNISAAVYSYSRDQLWEALKWPDKVSADNTFIRHIQNSHDDEIADFLLLAKELEERRREQESPWYYPSDPDKGESTDYEDIIEQIREYKGTRLADRYALQLVRALFASAKYDECVNEYEARLEKLPASNLFRRMALGYVAGCWSRMYEAEKANEYFAEAGDFESIDCANPLKYMADHNPDAPAYWSHIGAMVERNDSDAVRRLLPLTRQIIRSGKSRYNGDWLFLAAYIEGEYNENPAEAARLIRMALRDKFSQQESQDYARAYRMATDAAALNTSTLLADLRWMEGKVSLSNPEAAHWNRLMRNIVQMHWVPRLMERGNHTLAVLMAGYADNLLLSQQKVTICRDDVAYWETLCSEPIAEARKNPKWWNSEDYSNMSFQLMYSMSGDGLARVKSALGHGGALQRHLEKYARTDDHYLNELIGTIYLREQQYDKAARYLSRVPVAYQRLMNIYKGDYLTRDPFEAYATRFETGDEGTDYEWTCDWRQGNSASQNQDKDNAKLRFARRMCALKKAMTQAKDKNKRALAAFDYAVGLRNSFEECWALTQYYRGCIPGMFIPSLSDYGWEDYEPLAKWLEAYSDYDPREIEDTYQRTVDTILTSTDDPETLAKIHLRLRNLKTIARYYPDTATGRMLATSCDSWKDWL